jgi:hypothetical protein
MGIIGQMRNVVWITCRKDKQHDGRFYLFVIILQKNKPVTYYGLFLSTSLTSALFVFLGAMEGR